MLAIKVIGNFKVISTSSQRKQWSLVPSGAWAGVDVL